jgi:NADH-quinone oxidoreductase subunit A
MYCLCIARYALQELGYSHRRGTPGANPCEKFRMSDLTTGVIVWLFALVVLCVITLTLVLNRLLGGYRSDAEKETPFESGIPPTGDARIPFPMRYYLVAVSFLIFELEAAFLFAWAVDYWEVDVTATLGALVFILILLLGLVYEWRKGGLS